MKQIFPFLIIISGLALLTNAQTINNESNKSLQFSLYPNPAIDEVTIAIEKSGEEITGLSIYNAVGSLVYQQPVDGADLQEVKIDVTNFQKGVYIMQIDSRTGKATRKLIIK